MATISDIARLAGVSTATVSHVINSTHFVSEPIREQVLQVVQQLNYHPSTVARSLRTKATHSIGLIISDIELPFFATLVRGVQDVSARHGRTVLLANTDEAPEQEAAYIRMMWGKRVDGLIIAPTGTNAPLLAQMQGSGLPVVSVDRHCPGLVAPHVGIDNIRAAREATKYLLDRGHQRIGMLAGLPHVSTIAERVSGFQQAYSDARLPLDPDLIRYTDSRPVLGRVRADELLSMQPPITAILATVASLTLATMQVLRARGLKCPDDVSVIGFDDPDWAVISAPAITSVNQPAYELGQRAAEVLAGLIDGTQPPGDSDFILESHLILRESVCSLNPQTKLQHFTQTMPLSQLSSVAA